jgi:flagellar motor switch/type III secretory pathway protein FliN
MTTSPQIQGEVTAAVPSEPETSDGLEHLTHLMAIPLRAEVVLGTLQMNLRAISSLKRGMILKTNRASNEPLDLVVNTAPIASAEVYPTGEKLSVRVVELHEGSV